MDPARSRGGRVRRPPERLARAVAEALGHSVDLVADGEALPDGPGAYLLLLNLTQPLVLHIPHFAGTELGSGWYLYAGSARGPGGIRARAGRHLRAEKPVRWHIDHLTVTASGWAAAVPDAAECGLVARLIEAGGFETPVPGFGSSDCRTCAAHLLRYRGAFNPRR